VKEHFLEFVRTQHPDRHAALARRYARSAYLTPAEQQRITERVDAVVTPERRRRSRADTFGHPDATTPGSPDDGVAVEQLRLLGS
jgi:hypothetical protein